MLWTLVRRELLTNLLTLPVRSPVATLALVIAFFWLRQRRRRHQRQPSIAKFEQALRNARITLLPGETPREVLVRTSNLDLTPKHLANIQDAANEHERCRYQ